MLLKGYLLFYFILHFLFVLTCCITYVYPFESYRLCSAQSPLILCGICRA